MINIENLSFGFNNDTLIDNYNLKLSKGHYRLTSLNGTGKTTLLNIITGQIKDYDGQVTVLGQNIKDYDSCYIYNNLFAYARQKDDLIDQLTVKENLELYNLQDSTICEQILKDFDMEHYYTTKVSKLSGGERKRIQLAIVFSSNNPIIILDEPDNHLDQDSTNTLLRLIGNSDKLILVVSHNEFNSTKITDIELRSNYCYIDPNTNEQIERGDNYIKGYPKLKVSKGLLLLIIIFSFVIVFVALYQYQALIMIDNTDENINDFSNPNTLILSPPVDNYFSYLLQTPEWYDVTPFYLTDDFKDAIENEEGVIDVVPLVENLSNWFLIFDDNEIYYIQQDNVYIMPIPYEVAQNTELAFIKSEDITGRFPYDDANEILITSNYATENNLELGDTVSIEGENDATHELKTFSYEVVGIYTPKLDKGNEQYFSYSSNPLFMHYNDYTNPEVLEHEIRYVNANTPQTDVRDKIEDQAYYRRLYVRLEDEKSTRDLANKIFEYDPYIQIESNYDLGTNVIQMYINQKLTYIYLIYSIFTIVLAVIIYLLFLLTKREYIYLYSQKLYYAGFTSLDQKNLLSSYIMYIYISVMLCILGVGFLAFICQDPSLLMISIIIDTVLIFAISFTVRKTRYDYEIRTKYKD